VMAQKFDKLSSGFWPSEITHFFESRTVAMVQKFVQTLGTPRKDPALRSMGL
jgi:hypothetical protein